MLYTIYIYIHIVYSERDRLWVYGYACVCQRVKSAKKLKINGKKNSRHPRPDVNTCTRKLH